DPDRGLADAKAVEEEDCRQKRDGDSNRFPHARSLGLQAKGAANPRPSVRQELGPAAIIARPELFPPRFGRTHMTAGPRFSRRDALRLLALSALPTWPRLAQAQARAPITRPIPA